VVKKFRGKIVSVSHLNNEADRKRAANGAASGQCRKFPNLLARSLWTEFDQIVGLSGLGDCRQAIQWASTNDGHAQLC
jgi:hypothetical protein